MQWPQRDPQQGQPPPTRVCEENTQAISQHLTEIQGCCEIARLRPLASMRPPPILWCLCRLHVWLTLSDKHRTVLLPVGLHVWLHVVNVWDEHGYVGLLWTRFENAGLHV